ncbi:MAG: membrane protein [Porticoccaceae bacterium]|nr:MAG: membrane protein [Porticoccaceae bacterium]
MRPVLAACAALLGASGVLAGAFGAHGLAALVAPERLELWRTAVLYQLLHAPLAYFLAAVPARGGARLAGWLFVAGSLLFSGSLYLLVLGDQPRWGIATPVGGSLLIAGWVVLALASLGRRGRP